MTPNAAQEYVGPRQDEILDVLEARSRRYNAWLFDRARPWLGRRVLDAGAGIGTFTAKLAATVDEVVAAEPYEPYAERLRTDFAAHPNVEVHAAETHELPDHVGRFDSVLCLNVLEHIADHDAAVASFRERLTPGGRLLLLVPAHPRLFGAADRAVAHTRRYRKRDLRTLLERNGLEAVELRYVNPVGAAGWLVSSSLLRRTDLNPTALGLFDLLVPALRELDRVDLGVGLSLWAVARRPA